MVPFHLLVRYFINRGVTFGNDRLIFVRKENVQSTPRMPSVVRYGLFLFQAILIGMDNACRLINLFRRLASPMFLLTSTSVFRATIHVRERKDVVGRIAITRRVRTTVHGRTTRILLRLLTIRREEVGPIRRFTLLIQRAVQIHQICNKRVCVTRQVFLTFMCGRAALRVRRVRRSPIFRARLEAATSSFHFRFRLSGHGHLIRLYGRPWNLLVMFHVNGIRFQYGSNTEIVHVNVRNGHHGQRRVSTVAVLRHYWVNVTRQRASCINCADVVAQYNARPRGVIIAPLSIRVVVVARDVRSGVHAQSTIMCVTRSVRQISNRTLSGITRHRGGVVHALHESGNASCSVSVNVFIEFSTQFIRRLLGSVQRLYQGYLTCFQANVFKQGILTCFCRLIRYCRVPIVRIHFLLLSGLRLLFQVVGWHASFLLLAFTRYVPRCFIRLAFRYPQYVFRRVLGDLVLTVGVHRGVLYAFQRVRGNLRVSSFHANVDGNEGAT